MTRAQPEAVDFDQLEDPMPGCSYRLYSRHKSGKFKILWYHHLEGPGPVQEATFTSLEDSLELLIRYGKAIGDFQESIRGAFGWVFPEKEQPGGWLWTWENKWVYQPPSQPRGRVVGDVMRPWLKLMESAVEGANRIDRARCMRLLAAQRDAEAAEKSSPGPSRAPILRG